MARLLLIPLALLSLAALTLGRPQRFDYDDYDYVLEESEAPRAVGRGRAVPSKSSDKDRSDTTTPVPILKQINEHNEDGSYTYGYEAADGSFKLETRFPDGLVQGKYGYIDIDTGEIKVIEYGADMLGFQPVGDLPEGIVIPKPVFNNGTEDEEVEFDYDGIEVNAPRVREENRARGSQNTRVPPSQQRGQELKQPITQPPRPRFQSAPETRPRPAPAVEIQSQPRQRPQPRPRPASIHEDPYQTSFEDLQVTRPTPASPKAVPEASAPVRSSTRSQLPIRGGSSSSSRARGGSLLRERPRQTTLDQAVPSRAVPSRTVARRPEPVQAPVEENDDPISQLRAIASGQRVRGGSSASASASPSASARSRGSSRAPSRSSSSSSSSSTRTSSSSSSIKSSSSSSSSSPQFASFPARDSPSFSRAPAPSRASSPSRSSPSASRRRPVESIPDVEPAPLPIRIKARPEPEQEPVPVPAQQPAQPQPHQRLPPRPQSRPRFQPPPSPSLSQATLDFDALLKEFTGRSRANAAAGFADTRPQSQPQAQDFSGFQAVPAVPQAPFQQRGASFSINTEVY